RGQFLVKWHRFGPAAEELGDHRVKPVAPRADAAVVARDPGDTQRPKGPEAMTTIKASCPTCGEVELTPADVSLMVCSHAPLSYYAFTCATCCQEIRKPADDHVVSLLVSGGVPAQVWQLPAEALETKT